METAYQELLSILEENNKTIANIKAIRINFKDKYNFNFKYKKIYKLDDLHFVYDSGFGGDEFEGYVLLSDNTWLERYEYDGASWWTYKKYPIELEDLDRWLNS